jgi:ribosome-associated protein
MNSEDLRELVISALEETKAKDIVVLDVRKLTTVTDYMIVASGTSNRHVRSLADTVAEKVRSKGHRPTGIEGSDSGEWVLLDLQDVLVHVMLPRVREFYNLEKLWSLEPAADLAIRDR